MNVKIAKRKGNNRKALYGSRRGPISKSSHSSISARNLRRLNNKNGGNQWLKG